MTHRASKNPTHRSDRPGPHALARPGRSGGAWRLLVVDSEPEIVRALRLVLRAAGYDVDCASSMDAALTTAAIRPPDVVLAERVMPGGTAVELIRELRAWSTAPVLVMSSTVDVVEVVATLDAGADGFQPKPLGVEELLARLRALLRRTATAQEPVIDVGDLLIDLDAAAVSVCGTRVQLTPRQFRILRTLALNAGKLLTGPALLRAVWGPRYAGESHLLHSHISLLRRRLQPNRAGPSYIQTVHGVGYRLAVPGRT